MERIMIFLNAVNTYITSITVKISGAPMLNATIVERRERAFEGKIWIWFNFTTQIVTLDHSEGVIPTS